MTTQTLSQPFISGNSPFKASADLMGRIAIAILFLLAGTQKVQYFDGSAQYMASVGLPDFLLPAVIALEILGALTIIVGYQTRIIAFILAGFTATTAIIFHNNFSDQIQFLMFFKNIAIAGGFLILAAHGPGRYSLDARKQS